MLVQFKTALAVIFVAAMPMHLRANAPQASGEPLGAKEVRKAEKEAQTAADHLRLATWYQAEMQRTRTQLTEQEDLVKHFSQMPGIADRTKIPNPYWSAQALARLYREKLQDVTKLASSHLKMAEALQANATSVQ